MRFANKLAVSLFLVLASCKTTEVKTILPERIVQTEPSFDGNSQDSGVKDYIDGKGFLVTKSAAARYNALLFIYGKNHVPPIPENDGVIREGDLIYLTEILTRKRDSLY